MATVIDFRSPRDNGPQPMPLIVKLAVALIVLLILLIFADLGIRWSEGPPRSLAKPEWQRTISDIMNGRWPVQPQPPIRGDG